MAILSLSGGGSTTSSYASATNRAETDKPPLPKRALDAEAALRAEGVPPTNPLAHDEKTQPG
eukprot:CAMPEP_0182872960 /NCGR_PEP_ID=MMETSP0034_2-20130328/12037_1 /TAXON_ID=156128 /ORGANISM="Nephroselmis pyriformis, Strain CCMP717" /LENGTH=61 /DNA_ID=CAMNT_0025005581 /DNA_START=49 /DNA_END=230 /DNA_ORIENTATION=+